MHQRRNTSNGGYTSFLTVYQAQQDGWDSSLLYQM